MWKRRVRTCLERAISEIVAEATDELDPNTTIRTELDHMVRRTRLTDMAKRLREMLNEIEALPDAQPPARMANKQ